MPDQERPREPRISESAYRQLVELAPDLFWTSDLDGRWTYLNPATRRIYDAEPRDLIGRSMTERARNPDQDLRAFKEVLSGAELNDYRTVHTTVAGVERHLSFTVKPLLDAAGSVIGCQGVACDLTLQDQVLLDLEDDRGEAEREAAAKSAFLASMSHELRTPMNGVIGMVDLLLQSQLDDEHRSAVELIGTSARALLSVINDVLDFSKIEAGRMTLEAHDFDVVALVESVVALAEVTADRSKVRLSKRFGDGMPRLVRGDPGRLRQILTNLVGNAVKFTEDGEIEVAVSVEGEDESLQKLRFVVRDTGIGIPADRLDAIFEEYTQGDGATSPRAGGTGLGLAITKRLVALMGGDVRVSSALGQGSSFDFTVDLGSVEGVADDGRQHFVQVDGIRALVVGAEDTTRTSVMTALVEAGFGVDESADVNSALNALVDDPGRFSLVVMESYLPGPGGFGLARMIRERSELNHVKLAMLTSAGQRGDAKLCRELGISGYLSKPVTRTELLEALAAVVEVDATASRLVTKHSIGEARSRLRVLLAEDNPVNQVVAATMLRKRGHDVDVVVNGRDAVTAAQNTRYDVLLLDIRLPELSGLDALNLIRGSSPRDGAAVPAVAMTARVGEGVKEEYLSAGFDAYLAKPFRPHDFFAVVEGWGTAEPEVGSPSTSVDPGDPVDITALTDTMSEAGCADSVGMLLSVFMHDAPIRMDSLAAAVKTRQAESIEASAHVFRSAAATILATGLEGALHEVEIAGQREDVAAAVRLLRRTRREHAIVMDFLAEIGAQGVSEAV